ncbi:germin-like protein [Silene latifolia]|uniref:germin-like protein n=1 Tax=Silene latifolia TaxID=37657 RepID=UPI003D77FB76
MAYSNTFVFLILMAFTSSVACATDPTQLQDFCVGVNDPNQALFVNGMFCKNAMEATPEDFFFKGLDIPRKPNKLGVNVTMVTAVQVPGLNTLGISLARIDFAPYGLNPPHTHPRATEVLTVMEGTLYVGFVTSNFANGGNKLFSKVLNKGDVFVFPHGLVHFQFNIGNSPGVAIAGLNSQNPGVVTIRSAVFGAQSPVYIGRRPSPGPPVGY